MLREPATLVINVALPDHPDGEHGGIGVLDATRRGRDATND
jgi:hypothetical protein